MKTGFTFLTLVAILGGWLYVELAPYPSGKRMWRFQQLPGVRIATDYIHVRKARSAFEEAPGGSISFAMRTETTTWSSFDEWKNDFDAHDGPARVWIYSLQYVEQRQRYEEKLKEQAGMGDLGSLIAFMRMGANQLPDGTSISDALRATDTDKGRYFAAFNDNWHRKTEFTDSRKGMLLNALMLRENLPASWNRGHQQYQQQTSRAQRSLDAMAQEAEQGDPDAQWVIQRLNGDTVVRIQTSN